MSESEQRRDDEAASAAAAAPAEEPLPAAAQAAIALVEQSSLQQDVARPARRTRVLALVMISAAVFAFALCIFTGAMLALWASEEIVVRDMSPPMVVYVEENRSLVVGSHVAAGILTILGLLVYASLHLRLRRSLIALGVDEKVRKRVFSGWTVMPITVVLAAGLGTTAILGLALPDKPRTVDVLQDMEEREREPRPIEVDPHERHRPDPLEFSPSDRQLSPVPGYVDSPADQELWMLHTFWLPLLLGMLLMILLPAVYTLQRSRDALRDIAPAAGAEKGKSKRK